MKDQSKDADVVVLKTALKRRKNNQKCPICAKATVASHKPFCSKRCADIDLGKWLGEDYRIPSGEMPGVDDLE